MYVTDANYPHLGGNIEGGDDFTRCPNAWAHLMEQGYLNVLDVGCGQGHSMVGFRALGCNVIGIEGLPANASKCTLPTLQCDLQQQSLVLHGIDLVWCCEVVEHIEEQYIGNLLPILCCGKCLAMSYAIPNQDGHHHVNCQPEGYWIEKITACGMSYDKDYSDYVKSLDAHNNHFSWHGLVFRT